MMTMFDVTNWYWMIPNILGKVFSSATMSYLLDNNSTYVAWLRAGNSPTRIVSAQELVEVLVTQWMPRKLQDGITVQSSEHPEINGNYPLDQQAQQYIVAISTGISAGRGLPGGANTFMYNGHPFNEQTFLSFATAAESYVYELGQGLAQIVTTGEGRLPAATVTV